MKVERRGPLLSRRKSRKSSLQPPEIQRVQISPEFMALAKLEEVQDFLSDGGKRLIRLLAHNNQKHLYPGIGSLLMSLLDERLPRPRDVARFSLRYKARAYISAAHYFEKDGNHSGAITAWGCVLTMLKRAEEQNEPPAEGSNEGDYIIHWRTANRGLLDLDAMPEDEYMDDMLNRLLKHYYSGMERARMTRDYFKCVLLAVRHDKPRWTPALIRGLLLLDGVEDFPAGLKTLAHSWLMYRRPLVKKTVNGTSVSRTIEGFAEDVADTLAAMVDPASPNYRLCESCGGFTSGRRCNGCATHFLDGGKQVRA